MYRHWHTVGGGPLRPSLRGHVRNCNVLTHPTTTPHRASWYHNSSSTNNRPLLSSVHSFNQRFPGATRVASWCGDHDHTHHDCRRTYTAAATTQPIIPPIIDTFIVGDPAHPAQGEKLVHKESSQLDLDDPTSENDNNTTTTPTQQPQQPQQPHNHDTHAVPSESLFRRALPPSCISFASPEGKDLFREALLAGTMEAYFPLAAQYRTQSEPAFCGLGTLTMVLNTLDIDPRRVWKGPWRWFSEEMLDCCAPLERIREQGITLIEFLCLARCNGAIADVCYGSESSLEQFRSEVVEAMGNSANVIVASYSRKRLGQTGAGHFSPIGGYHPGRDMVLIMEVARFKYPPHWVPLSLLFEAMQDVDQKTGRTRGYLVMSAALQHQPTSHDATCSHTPPPSTPQHQQQQQHHHQQQHTPLTVHQHQQQHPQQQQHTHICGKT
eukprot:TRINITY_DN627_c2_g1_i1.p1 TRINITY_DN627_c2_g1~~TRINITY_DN627_c2_g1_i1.p1  ORF type:complete len:448 (-),score=93.51 TRINITY_DN627_c2_g1_i1:5-1318(-)